MPEKEGPTAQEFTYASQPGTERVAMDEIAHAMRDYLPPIRLEQLKTAVAEATLNAIEHGNHYQSEIPVIIQTEVRENEIDIRITDQGGEQVIPEHTMPNLEKKLAGLESPRGWGLFLIRNMVDEMRIESDGQQHTVHLVFYR